MIATPIVPFGQLQPATFVRRENRFLATVIAHGQVHSAHVPNSGRLRELLIPGAALLLQAAGHAGRRTSFDLLLTWTGTTWVCVDARLPPTLVRLAWEAGRLEPFRCYGFLRHEVALGNSRFDLVFTVKKEDDVPCWVETKSVTLVSNGVARFPDAPSERGRRHLLQLAEIASKGEGAAVVFVVQREDAESFAPNDETDAAFGAALRSAHAAGVLVLAYRCQVSPQGISLPEALPLALDTE